jgi:hypothetical protein
MNMAWLDCYLFKVEKRVATFLLFKLNIMSSTVDGMIMKINFEQWWSTIPPNHQNKLWPLTSNHWTLTSPRHIAFDINVLAYISGTDKTVIILTWTFKNTWRFSLIKLSASIYFFIILGHPQSRMNCLYSLINLRSSPAIINKTTTYSVWHQCPGLHFWDR